ncbi:hypothetical protein BC834DRAFT_111814 [Gloeopeniophorella convolvens]|nr:hypothetical protein BC834DRAFT_111814 [Gloeopeniophorella convolvens]
MRWPFKHDSYNDGINAPTRQAACKASRRGQDCRTSRSCHRPCHSHAYGQHRPIRANLLVASVPGFMTLPHNVEESGRALLSNGSSGSWSRALLFLLWRRLFRLAPTSERALGDRMPSALRLVSGFQLRRQDRRSTHCARLPQRASPDHWHCHPRLRFTNRHRIQLTFCHLALPSHMFSAARYDTSRPRGASPPWTAALEA